MSNLQVSQGQSPSPQSRPGLVVNGGHRISSSALIAIGFFAVTFSQPAQVGGLPLRLLLKDHLHLSPSALANFFAVAAAAWYLKPIAGLWCDLVPFLRSRRRSYLVASVLTGSLIWLAFGAARNSVLLLLSLAVLLNAAIVIASTVLGGVLVEAGRRDGNTGQLVSWKFVANNVAGLIVGPVSGQLAIRPLSATIWTGSLSLFPLSILGWMALRHEEPLETIRASFASECFRRIKTIAVDKGLVCGVAFLFLVGLAPGFDTPLLYYQTDQLHFGPTFLGWLAFTRGISGLAASGIYGILCDRWPLRKLLVIGILLHAFGSALFMLYRSPQTALTVEAIYGVCYTFAVLPLFDLAARATPTGSEALGLALVMSLWNVSNAVSDIIGSWLFGHYHAPFLSLVWLNAATTLCVLPFLRIIPAALVSRSQREERYSAAASDV